MFDFSLLFKGGRQAVIEANKSSSHAVILQISLFFPPGVSINKLYNLDF